jgi:hypothetical protein
MTTKQQPRQEQEAAAEAAARSARRAEADALLARLDARRAANDRLGLSDRDSTDILRELREHFAR